jgi:NAD-dependent histone deacetylase SIR2
MTAKLKERGLITFLRDYLKPDEQGEVASLRKLLLGFGIVPVSEARRAPVVCRLSSVVCRLSLDSSVSSQLPI